MRNNDKTSKSDKDTERYWIEKQTYVSFLKFISERFAFGQRSIPCISVLTIYGNENIGIRSRPFDFSSEHVDFVVLH